MAKLFGYEFKESSNTYPIADYTKNTVEIISNYIKDGMNVLDMGTGTGCIGISLKRLFPDIKMTCSDVSKEALEVAIENGKGLDITFIESNLLDNINDKFDIIIFNGPFIPMEYYDDSMKPNIAYFCEENGLILYKKLYKDCQNKITNNALLCLFTSDENEKELIDYINKPYIKHNIDKYVDDKIYIFDMKGD